MPEFLKTNRLKCGILIGIDITHSSHMCLNRVVFQQIIHCVYMPVRMCAYVPKHSVCALTIVGLLYVLRQT